MKILVGSHLFLPSVGGIEQVSAILGEEFCRRGHEVVVVTQTPGEPILRLQFPVIRKPSMSQLMRLVKWCDVFFHNNVSVRAAWPLLFVKRPWVVAHQTWITRITGRRSWQDHLKLLVIRRARNVAISHAIAQELPVSSEVIPNPYRSDVFRTLRGIRRDRELIFVGRLVSDKGVEVLLHAAGELRARGLKPRLTIVGEGPERHRLEALANSTGIREDVVFAGSGQGEELVERLNAHRILVVPSIWNEPFGIVALEGIACGCFVVGSSGGGLPEAIGPCGKTFPNGDSSALAEALEKALTQPKLDTDDLRKRAEAHLDRHKSGTIAEKYLSIFRTAIVDAAR